MQEVLHYIETCFTEFNDYQNWLLKQTLESFKKSNIKHNNNINMESHNDTNINRLPDETVHILKLPCKGDHSIDLMK